MIGTDLNLALELNPTGVDARDADGRTPLHWACARGNVEAAKMLLRFGADPDVPDDIGQACLRTSLKTADTRCAKLLVEAGAHLEARDNWQQTPFLASNYGADPLAFGLVLLDADGKTAQDIAHERRAAKGTNNQDLDIDIEKQDANVVDSEWMFFFSTLTQSCSRAQS